jgi:hypothetical protein
LVERSSNTITCVPAFFSPSRDIGATVTTFYGARKLRKRFASFAITFRSRVYWCFRCSDRPIVPLSALQCAHSLLGVSPESQIAPIHQGLLSFQRHQCRSCSFLKQQASSCALRNARLFIERHTYLEIAKLATSLPLRSLSHHNRFVKNLVKHDGYDTDAD